jgi:hypothetical protein
VDRAAGAGLWAHALALAATLPRPAWSSTVARWLRVAAAPSDPLYTVLSLWHTSADGLGTLRAAPLTQSI